MTQILFEPGLYNMGNIPFTVEYSTRKILPNMIRNNIRVNSGCWKVVAEIVIKAQKNYGITFQTFVDGAAVPGALAIISANEGETYTLNTSKIIPFKKDKSTLSRVSFKLSEGCKIIGGNAYIEGIRL